MLPISVERLVLNVFIGENGDRLISPHLQKRGVFLRHDHHLCFDSDSWYDFREIITEPARALTRETFP